VREEGMEVQEEAAKYMKYGAVGSGNIKEREGV